MAKNEWREWKRKGAGAGAGWGGPLMEFYQELHASKGQWCPMAGWVELFLLKRRGLSGGTGSTDLCNLS